MIVRVKSVLNESSMAYNMFSSFVCRVMGSPKLGNGICGVPNNRFANIGTRLPLDVLRRVLIVTSANEEEHILRYQGQGSRGVICLRYNLLISSVLDRWYVTKIYV